MTKPLLQNETPSSWSREVVAGAYDLHVHIEPDVMRRRISDLDLARRFEELRLGGFALKSHYVPTTERASVVRAATGVDVLGAITLNGSVGGLNAMAVEIAAREGVRIVWLPTVDAENHRRTAYDLPPGSKPPMWLALQEELRDRGLDIPPVGVIDAEGRPTGELVEVLELVAEHDLVLATGHLGRDEIMVATDEALRRGVQRVIVTHPEFPQQNLDPEDQAELARRGCFLERCFTTPYTGKCDWGRMVANIRSAGATQSIVASDLGQPDNPPVEDGLALMADALLAAGFEEKEIHTMVVANSRALAGEAR